MLHKWQEYKDRRENLFVSICEVLVGSQSGCCWFWDTEYVFLCIDEDFTEK